MKKGTKIFLIILAVIAALVIFAYAFIKKLGNKYWQNITFSKPTLKQDIVALTQASISGGKISIPFPFTINNGNDFEIPFSSISAQLKYSGVVVGETNDPSSYTVPAKGSLTISPLVIFNLDKNTVLDIIKQKISGQHPQLDYTITLNIFGVSIPPITDTLTW